MKHYASISRTIALSLALLTGWTAAGCDSDDKAEPGAITPVTRLEAEIDGALLDIPIQADGRWTATLSDEADGWAMLSATEGTGSTTLYLGIDPIEEGTPGRHATLTLQRGSQETVIEVIQLLQIDGKPLGNSMEYATISSTKGLGRGFDPYNTTNRIRKQVINFKTVKRLVDECGAKYEYLYAGSPISGVTYEYSEQESSEDKDDTLTVHMDINIGFAMFTLEGMGHYSSDEDRYDSTLCFKLGVSVPRLASQTSCLDVLAYYEEAAAKKSNGEKMSHADSLSLNLLSSSFVKCRSDVIDALGNDRKLETAVRNMIDDYGIGVTSATMLGGSVALHLDVDSVHTKEHAAIDSAQLSAGFKAFLLNIEAETYFVMREYVDEALRHSKCSYAITGGSGTARSEIYKQLSQGNYAGVRQKVIEWMESIEVSDDGQVNNADLIETDLYPIWDMLGFDASARVRAMVESCYADPNGWLEKLY